MYPELEMLLKKLYNAFYDPEQGVCKPFTEKELVKRKLITKLELEDFDALYDEGLIDVVEMSEVVEGSQEIKYTIAKEVIDYLNIEH